MRGTSLDETQQKSGSSMAMERCAGFMHSTTFTSLFAALPTFAFASLRHTCACVNTYRRLAAPAWHMLDTYALLRVHARRSCVLRGWRVAVLTISPPHNSSKPEPTMASEHTSTTCEYVHALHRRHSREGAGCSNSVKRRAHSITSRHIHAARVAHMCHIQALASRTCTCTCCCVIRTWLCTCCVESHGCHGLACPPTEHDTSRNT